MIVSKGKGFAFIEVPKTASSSIRSQLLKYDDFGQELGKHAPARVVRDHVGEKSWDDLYSFAVIRSPENWIKSWYKYWRGITLNEGLSEADKRYVGEISFDEFVERAACARASDKYGNIGHQHSKVLSQNKKNLLVKKLICFDYLSSEYDSLRTHLGLPDNTTLPKKNVSGYAPKGDQIDSGTARRIRDRWSIDAEIYEGTYKEARQLFGE